MALPYPEYDMTTDQYLLREPEPKVDTEDLLYQVIANTPAEDPSYQKYEPVVNKTNFWEKPIRASEVILDQEYLRLQRNLFFSRGAAYYREISGARFNPSICNVCGGIDPDCPKRNIY